MTVSYKPYQRSLSISYVIGCVAALLFASQVASSPQILTSQKQCAIADLMNNVNSMRSKYQAPPLTWDVSLASSAEKNAMGCDFHHSTTSKGENLAMSTASDYTAVGGVIDWMSEAATYYQYSINQFNETTGHFTQVSQLFEYTRIFVEDYRTRF